MSALIIYFLINLQKVIYFHIRLYSTIHSISITHIWNTYNKKHYKFKHASCGSTYPCDVKSRSVSHLLLLSLRMEVLNHATRCDILLHGAAFTSSEKY